MSKVRKKVVMVRQKHGKPRNNANRRYADLRLLFADRWAQCGNMALARNDGRSAYLQTAASTGHGFLVTEQHCFQQPTWLNALQTPAYNSILSSNKYASSSKHDNSLPSKTKTLFCSYLHNWFPGKCCNLSIHL